MSLIFCGTNGATFCSMGCQAHGSHRDWALTSPWVPAPDKGEQPAARTVSLTVAELKVGDVILWPAGHTSTVAGVRYTRTSAMLRLRDSRHEMRKALTTTVRVLAA